MAFEAIECVKPAKAAAPKVPPLGVAVSPRRMGRPSSRGGGCVTFIVLKIGAKLARGCSLTQGEHGVALAFGTGADAGKVMVSVDNAAGRWRAKRDKAGNYALTINAATAEGLFSLNFPAFTREACEAVRPVNGQPVHFIFQASKEMLELDEG